MLISELLLFYYLYVFRCPIHDDNNFYPWNEEMFSVYFYCIITINEKSAGPTPMIMMDNGRWLTDTTRRMVRSKSFITPSYKEKRQCFTLSPCKYIRIYHNNKCCKHRKRHLTCQQTRYRFFWSSFDSHFFLSLLIWVFLIHPLDLKHR